MVGGITVSADLNDASLYSIGLVSNDPILRCTMHDTWIDVTFTYRNTNMPEIHHSGLMAAGNEIYAFRHYTYPLVVYEYFVADLRTGRVYMFIAPRSTQAPFMDRCIEIVKSLYEAAPNEMDFTYLSKKRKNG